MTLKGGMQGPSFTGIYVHSTTIKFGIVILVAEGRVCKG